MYLTSILIYSAFLLLLLLTFFVSRRHLHAFQKNIYTSFENYLARVYSLLQTYHDHFYHKEKSRDVFYANIISFFSLSSYPIKAFLTFEKKFSQDALFLSSLLPEGVDLTFEKHERPLYNKAYTREAMYRFSDILLTISTLGIWKLFSTK